jgi:ubiquinone biosynthesis protein COQ4
MYGYANPDGVVPDRRSWRRVAGYWLAALRAALSATVRGRHGRFVDRLNQAVLGVINPTSPHMFAIMHEVYAPALARLYYQVRAHPHGHKIIRDKPDLLEFLRDDQYLASLPVGTLGHGYRSFMMTNRLDACVYHEADVIRPLAQAHNWHEDFFYFMVRHTVVHDLLHVVAGYGPDIVGEVLAIGFQSGQTQPAGIFEKLGYAGAVRLPGAALRHKLRVYRKAIERGSRADKLAAAPWEELLAKPLDDVRALLGVASVGEDHPTGLWFTSWMPPGLSPATRWDYDEILAEARAGDAG